MIKWILRVLFKICSSLADFSVPRVCTFFVSHKLWMIIRACINLWRILRNKKIVWGYCVIFSNFRQVFCPGSRNYTMVIIRNGQWPSCLSQQAKNVIYLTKRKTRCLVQNSSHIYIQKVERKRNLYHLPNLGVLLWRV